MFTFVAILKWRFNKSQPWQTNYYKLTSLTHTQGLKITNCMKRAKKNNLSKQNRNEAAINLRSQQAPTKIASFFSINKTHIRWFIPHFFQDQLKWKKSLSCLLGESTTDQLLIDFKFKSTIILTSSINYRTNLDFRIAKHR